MTFVYPNTCSTFKGDRKLALAVGYVEVEDSVYADLVETKKKWDNGVIVDDPTYPERKRQREEAEERRRRMKEIQTEVLALKKKLSESDYKAIKYSEGWITEEDYAPIKAERQAIRDQINALENG